MGKSIVVEIFDLKNTNVNFHEGSRGEVSGHQSQEVNFSKTESEPVEVKEVEFICKMLFTERSPEVCYIHDIMKR